jgi:3',5'-cyclic AMP phosphodiesterase CpdA
MKPEGEARSHEVPEATLGLGSSASPSSPLEGGGPVRLAHISDIHLTAPKVSWRREDWFNKRLAAWANLRLLGRGFRFRHAEEVLAALTADLSARGPAHVVFSGDATAMGFGEEAEKAASLLGVTGTPGLAIPGNHDYCTVSAQRERHFEKSFAPWQVGLRVDEETYPFAQRVGHAWLVAVNSSSANRWPWDATGRVGLGQLQRLERLLAQLEGGPKVLVTHYPVVRPSGWPEPYGRRLRDLARLRQVAEKGGVALWLHGHIHKPYRFAAGAYAPFPVVCAGSGTQTGYWSYGEYLLQGRVLIGRQRVYHQESGEFREGEAFELRLREE